MNTRIAIFLVVFGIPVPAGISHAQDAPESQRSALRLSVSDAVKNAAGSIIVSGRYGGDWGARVGFWAHAQNIPSPAESPRVFVATDHIWAGRKWRFGLGAVWIDEVSNINGTHLNFIWSLSYDLPGDFFVEALHISHGASFGIRSDVPNRGWNFIGIGYAL